jgi:hypothetical protein
MTEPGSSIESMVELIGAAAITGASLHIAHVNSTCLRAAPECVRMINDARRNGVDVTAETFADIVAMTAINSAVFGPGWAERRGLDYSDIEIPGTGERLTRERFDQLHASPDPIMVLLHVNRDEDVRALVADSTVIIASDGLAAHPRAIGTFSRVLGTYVRTENALSLPAAIRKMSYLPARRLEQMTTVARRLGRIQVGAQADIVVFDPVTIEDRATFESPSVPSVGVEDLLVAGTIVVQEGKLVDGVAPGRAVTRDRP